MKAGIIDSRDKSGFWEDSIGETFDCHIASDVNELDECDILLVSADNCGGSVDTVIKDIRSSEKLADVPTAVIVDGSSTFSIPEFLKKYSGTILTPSGMTILVSEVAP